MNEAFAAFTAFLITALPLAVGVAKVVDTIRNLFGTAQANVPKWVWNVLALVVGVLTAVGFEINLLAPIAAAIPALKDWSPDSTMAEILTGISIGAMAGFWHEKMDEWSAIAKANKAEIATGTQG